MHYRPLEQLDARSLSEVASGVGAARVVTAGIGFQPEVHIQLLCLDAASGSVLAQSDQRCAPALLLAVLPGVYRWIASMAGASVQGIPAFLGEGRSETALFALALDLDNDDLLTSAAGQLPFDDPFSARYLPLLEALRLDPGFVEAKQRLLERCRNAPANETDLAVNSLERAAQLAENPQEFLLALALLLESRRRQTESVDVLARSLEANPGDVDSRMHYGRLLLLTGHSHRAGAHLTEADRLRPSDWRSAFWLGRLSFEQGDQAGAARWYAKALNRGMPEGPERKRAESAVQRAR